MQVVDPGVAPQPFAGVVEEGESAEANEGSEPGLIGEQSPAPVPRGSVEAA